MSYVNYEHDIVLEYSIILEGWTHLKWLNPRELGSGLLPVQTLFNAIQSGQCKFVKLSAQEHEARQAEHDHKILNREIQQCKRKEQSNKGKKRKRLVKVR